MGQTRRKRSLTPLGVSHRRWVEVMVVADRKMKQYHGEDLTDYILTVMATVSQQFYYNVMLSAKGSLTLSHASVHLGHRELFMLQTT